jgi:hypothetical protein
MQNFAEISQLRTNLTFSTDDTLALCAITFNGGIGY